MCFCRGDDRSIFFVSLPMACFSCPSFVSLVFLYCSFGANLPSFHESHVAQYFARSSASNSWTPRAAGSAGTMAGASSGAGAGGGGATFAEVERLQSVARQRQGQADALQQR